MVEPAVRIGARETDVSDGFIRGSLHEAYRLFLAIKETEAATIDELKEKYEYFWSIRELDIKPVYDQQIEMVREAGLPQAYMDRFDRALYNYMFVDRNDMIAAWWVTKYRLVSPSVHMYLSLLMRHWYHYPENFGEIMSCHDLFKVEAYARMREWQPREFNPFVDGENEYLEYIKELIRERVARAKEVLKDLYGGPDSAGIVVDEPDDPVNKYRSFVMHHFWECTYQEIVDAYQIICEDANKVPSNEAVRRHVSRVREVLFPKGQEEREKLHDNYRMQLWESVNKGDK